MILIPTKNCIGIKFKSILIHLLCGNVLRMHRAKVCILGLLL